MGYCSLGDIEKVLAQTLTTASTATSVTGLPGKLTSIGRQLKLNLITEDDANFYIRLADSHINAALSQQYATPLKESCDEFYLAESMSEYSETIHVTNGYLLTPGDIIVLSDGQVSERAEVLSVELEVITTREPVMNLFSTPDTRVLRLKYPDPIAVISARLAAATIYDKYARAQSEPGKTEFGNSVRNEALAELNNIREGRTILHGVERIGWRFANSELLDRYTVKGGVEQDGTRSDDRKGAS